MGLIGKGQLSVLALITFITISLKAYSITQPETETTFDQSDTSLPEPAIVPIDADTTIGVAMNHAQPQPFAADKSVAFRRAVIAPVLFTAAGLFTLGDDNDDNYEVQEEKNRYIPNFRNHADDYLQHLPIVMVYGLNSLGVKGKNDFANRTAILIKSEVLVGVLTFSLKRITAVPRPDTKQATSFPSGHTAQAFAAATFMAREYGHRSIWYSIGAYTIATGVGAMRVMNNRHWVSDVLAGAGIGILSTNLVYLTHRYRWGKKNQRGQTSIMPFYDGQTGMVSIIHRIN